MGSFQPVWVGSGFVAHSPIAYHTLGLNDLQSCSLCFIGSLAYIKPLYNETTFFPYLNFLLFSNQTFHCKNQPFLWNINSLMFFSFCFIENDKINRPLKIITQSRKYIWHTKQIWTGRLYVWSMFVFLHHVFVLTFLLARFSLNNEETVFKILKWE